MKTEKEITEKLLEKKNESDNIMRSIIEQKEIISPFESHAGTIKNLIKIIEINTLNWVLDISNLKYEEYAKNKELRIIDFLRNQKKN